MYSASKGFTEYQQHNENVWCLAGVLKKKTTNLCARMNKLCTQINNLYGSLGFNAVLFGFWMDMHGNTSHFAHSTSIKYVKCQYGEWYVLFIWKINSRAWFSHLFLPGSVKIGQSEEKSIDDMVQ